MAINIPLVHISDLTEKKTISDSDYMLTGGSTASKVKWSTIVSLIKTKLGIGNIEDSISKIQSDISTLNSDFDTIIVGTTATTANQTINHYGDRKLSDYKFITFAFGTSDTDIRGVVTIPRVLFSQIKKVYIYVAHGSNDDIISIVYFTYINDVSTSVRLSADHGVKYIKCLGVK